MNWKKAGLVLATLGVTATVCYVSYSFVFVANKKDLENFKEKLKGSDFYKGIDSGKEEKMLKNIHNLSKKQLIRLGELISKKDLSDLEKKELSILKTKWKYEN
jgi:hypothetical protein